MATPLLLPRRPLVDRLERALAARLVRVVARAGCGKSTLVRLAARRSQREVVHVRLDHRSGDASYFFWQLLDALGLEHAELLPERSTPMENVHAIAEEIASRPPCVLALDEAEQIEGQRPVLDTVARLARQMPQGTSLLVLSRRPLAFPLEAGDDVVDLQEADLALDAAEVGELVRRIAPDAELSDEDALSVHDLTRGRVLLVQLFALASRGHASTSLLRDLEWSADALAPLLDAALSDLPEASVHGLERVAVLDSLPEKVAARVAGDELPWAELLPAAVERGLIDASADPPAFPRSVSDALRERLRRRPEAWNAAQRAAAAAMREQRDPERALHHLIEAGDIDDAVGVLILEGLPVITFNRIQALDRLLTRLPVERVEGDPVLRFIRGTVRIVRMEIDAAKDDLRAAAEGAEAAGIADVADAARVRLGLTALFQGHLEDSVRENERIAARRTPDDPIGILAWANLEMALRYLGRDDEADRVAARVDASRVEYPDRLPVPGARCFVARLRGDFEAQRTLGMQGAAAAREHHAPGGLCFLLLHVSEGALAAGRAQEAFEVADEAVSICRSMREHWWEIVSRQSRVGALQALGRHEEARRDAREIIAAGSAYGGLHWTATEAALRLSELPGEDADEALAVASENAGLTTHPELRARVALARARRALELEDPERARAELDAAERELGSVMAPPVRHGIRLLRARDRLAAGKSRDAQELLAGHLAETPALRRERRALLPALVALALQGDEQARAQVIASGTDALPHLARRRGPAADALREAVLDSRARPLHVRSLGSFEVVRRGDGADETVAFRSPRVAELFRLLLARSAGGGNVPGEVLVDVFWPDQPLDVARRSLHTHLTWLRRALEPDLPPRTQSRYLVRDEAGYRLELRGGEWDAALFRRDAEAGLRARRAGDTLKADALLQSALARYHGPLFAEQPYAEALGEERSHLARLFADASLAAARLALELSKPDAARERLESLLAEDASVEAAWAGLMETAAALGRTDDVPLLLTRCRDALRREVDAEPSQEIEALARRLASTRA